MLLFGKGIYLSQHSLAVNSKLPTCPRCGGKETGLILRQQTHYYSFCSLSLAPYKKATTYHCLQCQYDLVSDNNSTKTTVLPWYFYLRFFVGSIVLIFACVFFLRWHYQDLQQQEAWLNTPLVNDIYYIDHEKLHQSKGDIYRYGLAKVVGLGDKVSLVYGRHRYQRQRHIAKDIRSDKLILPQYFEKQSLAYHLDELKVLYKQGALISIERSPDGMHLFGGTIILPQKREARVKLRRPGEQENQQAIMHYQGLKVELDKQEAARLFKVAAKKGHAFAQYNLAQMFHLGDGIDKDIAKAVYWYQAAAKQNHVKAKNELSTLCKIHDCQ